MKTHATQPVSVTNEIAEGIYSKKIHIKKITIFIFFFFILCLCYVKLGISFADALSGVKNRKIITTQDQQPPEKSSDNNDNNKNDNDNDIKVNAIEKDPQIEPQSSSLPPNEKESSIQEQKDELIQSDHDNVKTEITTTGSNPKTLEEIEAQLRSSSSLPNNHDHDNPIQNNNNNNNNNLISGNGGNNLLHVLLPGLSPNPPQQQSQTVQGSDAHPQTNIPFDINTFFRNHNQQQGHFIPHPNMSAINRDLVQKPNLTIEQELKQNKEDNVNVIIVII